MFRMIRFGVNGLTRRLKERDAIRRLRWLDNRMVADMGVHRSQIQAVVKCHTSGNPL